MSETEVEQLAKQAVETLSDVIGPNLTYPSAEVDVDIGDIVVLLPPQAGITTGLGPCLGFAIMCQNSGRTILGHLPSIAFANEEDHFRKVLS